MVAAAALNLQSSGILGTPMTSGAKPRPTSLSLSLPCCSLSTRQPLKISVSQVHRSSFFGNSVILPWTLPENKKKQQQEQQGQLVIVGMSMEAGIGVMGTKLGMMSYFEPEGNVVPVTVVGFREGNIVTQIKTVATDGYDAVQVGYRRVRDRKLTKPELGHLNKVGAIPMRHLQEFRLQASMVAEGDFQPNQRLDFAEIFKEGDLVDVSGTTIGKGFQGGIKRHHFRRGPMSHGSKSHRALGSIGAGTTPGRVYPGKKMPGRMGGTTRKIRKLPIVKIDHDLRVLMIKGALPGKPGNLLRIAPAKIVGKNIPKN